MKRLLLGMSATGLLALTIALGTLAPISSLEAQVYSGGGFGPGLTAAGRIEGPVKKPIRTIIVGILQTVLSFMALAAVIAIVVAGIYLIVSGGSDDGKTKARRIIIWAVVGIVVLLFAKAIVAITVDVVT